MEKWVVSGQDISDCCIKCGSKDVIEKRKVKVEYAPFWATYLKATGVLSFIYGMVVQKGVLHIGLCAKHYQSGLVKRVKAYTTLLVGSALIGLSALENNPLLGFIGVGVLLLFYSIISNDIVVRVLKIEGENILLSPKMHIPHNDNKQEMV